jgi:hypothetical protein
MRCNEGQLIPLSDYGREGAPITYKAWVCTNPACGFNVRIDNGEISVGRALGQSTMLLCAELLSCSPATLQLCNSGN